MEGAGENETARIIAIGVRPGRIEKGTLLDGRVTALNIAAVLTNVLTGEKRVVPGGNIITDIGDHYYAHAIAKGILGVEALTMSAIYFSLGTNAGTPGAPLKTDTSMTTTTGSTLRAPVKAPDSGYPKTDDPDTNNPGAATDTISWRVSYATSEMNYADIATLELAGILGSICIANFAEKFSKTSAQTLQVYANCNAFGYEP